MTVYIKKQIYSHGDSYEVCDDRHSILYTAKGDVYTREAKLHLYNKMGEELVSINQKRMSHIPSYEININGSLYATLSKQTSWRNTTVEVDSIQGKFIVSKDFSGNDYHITFNGSDFGIAKKDSHTRQVAYVLTLYTEEHLEFFVAMLLAMDNLISHEGN